MPGGVVSGGPMSVGTAAGGLMSGGVTSGGLTSGGAMSGGLTAHGSPGGSAGEGVENDRIATGPSFYRSTAEITKSR